MFSWEKTKKPILALAPMSGYTDSAFRQLVKSLSPTTIVFSEFVSSDALHFKSKKTKAMLSFAKKEKPVFIQIFGKNPSHFAEATKVVESLGGSGVDLNMGCPARKVVNSLHGSALIKTPKLASEIIEACAKSVKIPISVKTRLGISDAKNLKNFAKMVESSGAKLLTIHGRFAKQMYSGEANYQPIYEVKRCMKIPVLGNGDIRSVEDFHTKLGNLDGLMVGRGVVNNPWLMREIENSLQGKNSKTPKSLKAKLPTILKHAKLMVREKGEKRGMMEMRKFLANYVKSEKGVKKLRAKLVRVKKFKEVEKILKAFVKKSSE